MLHTGGEIVKKIFKWIAFYFSPSRYFVETHLPISEKKFVESENFSDFSLQNS